VWAIYQQSILGCMYKFDGFEFDKNSAKLTSTDDGQSIYLRQKLVSLLMYLLTHSSRVVSKQELLDTLWDHGQYRERSLSQSILELRKALGDSASAPHYIRTIPNQGYQWICPAQPVKQDQKPVAQTLNTDSATLKSSSVDAVSAGPRKKLLRTQYWLFPLTMLIFAAFIYWGYKDYNANKSLALSPVKNTSATVSVLVLPFVNESGTSAMNWVQYGLSEMLAYDLALIKQLKVIAPTQLNSGSFKAQLSKESIRQLINQYNADMAIHATISLKKGQQVISYSLITPRGTSDQKHLQRADLAISMPDVASKIYRDIQPNIQTKNLPNYTYTASAMHDFARGLQALQSDSYILAQHYFQASMQIDKSHHWSVLYQGISQLQLGHWTRAEKLFFGLESSNTEAAILASVNYWQALLYYRQGQFSQSLKYLKTSNAHLETHQQPLVLAKVVQLETKLKQLQFARDTPQLVSDNSSEEASVLFEVPLFNSPQLYTHKSTENFTVISRQLTVKGHKPALLKLLVTHSLSGELTTAQRASTIARAVEIARELQQPYDLALTLTVQARIALAEQLPHSKTYLLQARQIAQGLKAAPLSAEIDFYITMSEAITALNLKSKAAIVQAQTLLLALDNRYLDAHKSHLKNRIKQSIQSYLSAQ